MIIFHLSWEVVFREVSTYIHSIHCAFHPLRAWYMWSFVFIFFKDSVSLLTQMFRTLNHSDKLAAVHLSVCCSGGGGSKWSPSVTVMTAISKGGWWHKSCFIILLSKIKHWHRCWSQMICALLYKIPANWFFSTFTH